MSRHSIHSVGRPEVKGLPPLTDRERLDPVAGSHDGESPARSSVRLANDEDPAGPQRLQQRRQQALLLGCPHQMQHIEQQDDVRRRQSGDRASRVSTSASPSSAAPGKRRHARPRLDADHRVEAGRRRSNPGARALIATHLGEQRQHQTLTAADVEEHRRE